MRGSRKRGVYVTHNRLGIYQCIHCKSTAWESRELGLLFLNLNIHCSGIYHTSQALQPTAWGPTTVSRSTDFGSANAITSCIRKTGGLQSRGLHSSHHRCRLWPCTHLCVKKSGAYRPGAYTSRTTDFGSWLHFSITRFILYKFASSYCWVLRKIPLK